MTAQITYIGHATTLLEVGGAHFLTDPLFSRRMLLLKRCELLQYDPATLPNLAAVLLSHPHHDHLDLFSFKYIPSTVPIITGEGMEAYIGRFVNNPVIELNTWAKHKVGNVEITLVPAIHTAHRWPWPVGWKNAHGFVLSDGRQTVYFAGDSAYGKHFSEIGQLFHPDVALLPISPCWPQWYYRQMHMNPDQALQAFEDLKARKMVPIHWGTFSLGLEPVTRPIEWLKEKAAATNRTEQVHILHSGETLTLA